MSEPAPTPSSRRRKVVHEKLDHLINRQWERLAQIQQIQLEIMEDLPLRSG